MRALRPPALASAVLILAAGFLLSPSGCAKRGAGKPVYLDTDAPLDRRVDDLVARMTLEEKVSQMMNEAPAVERLGIPAYNWWGEALHGVARAGLATVFPQAIGLAAAWDTELLGRVATAISDEARAKHHEFARRGRRGLYQGLTFWSPNINLFRDPRWGRGMETYGEDPYLTGRLGVSFIRGLQGNDPKYLKVVATPKHYAVHSGPEPDRHSFEPEIDERDFRESYLPHFQACIEEAKAFSIMCAYNSFGGFPCCGNPRLLLDILRKEWGFGGYVVSDCGAVDDIRGGHKKTATTPKAAAMAVKAGCDLDCGNEYTGLLEAVRAGLLTEKDIDVSVRRLFRARFKLGTFDPPESVPYARIPYSVVDSDTHRLLALEAARKSIVLLKNQDGLLPLAKDIKTIAVIGPNAADPSLLLGNYNGTPFAAVTPLQGIMDKVAPGTKVLYAMGCPPAAGLPALKVVPSTVLMVMNGNHRENGLRGEYYGRGEFTGDPAFVRIDKIVDFQWPDASPHEGFPADDYAVRWSGMIVPPADGEYALGGEGFNAFKIYFEDKLLVEYDGRHEPGRLSKNVRLHGGVPYRIRLEMIARSTNGMMRLLWSPPTAGLKKEALEKAAKSDAVVLCLGLTPQLEGEEMDVPVEGFRGGDRLTLDLPRVQEELAEAVAALGKPTILVLLNGSALAVNWAAERLPAVIEAWYPGQAAGPALADVLFGDYNPAGRLPITFYTSADELPPFKDYRMQGRTYRFYKGKALFPFGYGLSYTRFEYVDLRLPAAVEAGRDFEVAVDVRNSGGRAGEEVVQLYITNKDASVPVPLRSLQGFKRILLNPGESQTVTFIVQPGQLSVLDKDFKRIVEPGRFEIAVGGLQPGFQGRTEGLTSQVLTAALQVGARGRAGRTN
jgi:beta-glucosidase